MEAEGAVGSIRWPPLGKLMLEMKDRSRPSEHGGVERDIGGLLSSTKNWERSRGACTGLVFPGVSGGVPSGMHEERFTRIGDCVVALGKSPVGEGECTIFPGAVVWVTSIGCASCERGDGLTCKEVWCGLSSMGTSCNLERERGEGVAMSNVCAAQSQWVDRAP